MLEKSIKNRLTWLPKAIAIAGCSISALIFYILWHNIKAYLAFLHHLEPHLPWMAGTIGVVFSLLLAQIVHMMVEAQNRYELMHLINDNLKNEINERQLSEINNKQLEEALIQGQKLQAIGTLAGGIAHDFNNILYAIQGYAEMARDDVKEESNAQQNLKKLLAAAKRGQELVSRILIFSRTQKQQKEKIHLHHAIETALQLLRPAIASSIQIDYQHEDDPVVLGNQTHLHQIFVNLINNAVDAMDNDGVITIRLTHDAHASKACITISDTGHGMDQEKMKRIFEPFFTTKEVGKGTGLGLSIVHSLVEEHEGHISVKSELGRGSTFTLLLPEHKE